MSILMELFAVFSRRGSYGHILKSIIFNSKKLSSRKKLKIEILMNELKPVVSQVSEFEHHR